MTKKDLKKSRTEHDEWIKSIRNGQVEILNIVKNQPGVDL